MSEDPDEPGWLEDINGSGKSNNPNKPNNPNVSGGLDDQDGSDVLDD